MIHILISPIRSVIHEIPDSDAWYILCFSARRELEPSPNARAFYVLDTTEEIDILPRLKTRDSIISDALHHEGHHLSGRNSSLWL